MTKTEKLILNEVKTRGYSVAEVIDNQGWRKINAMKKLIRKGLVKKTIERDSRFSNYAIHVKIK